jgi:hypothetical protein
VELTGAFIQPCLLLMRQMAINVVSLACVSWGDSRGSENQSVERSGAKPHVNLDKREQRSVTYPQALSTGDCRMPDLRPDERR